MNIIMISSIKTVPATNKFSVNLFRESYYQMKKQIQIRENIINHLISEIRDIKEKIAASDEV